MTGEPAEVAKATLMDHSSLITTREFTNELGNCIKITIEGPNSLSENILTPLETRELSHSLNEMERALAADRTKLRALGADPGPTEDDLFSNGIMDLNSALEFAEGMMDAPGYGDMQDALGVLAKAYRKAEDRIGELLVKNDAKAAALSRAEALLAEAREKGQFLADRLNELEWPDDASAVWREYAGHVEPALERFRALLAKLEQG